jgi:predicted MFS family arabinose efflux permease
MATAHRTREVDAGSAFPWRVTAASVLTISVGMLPGFLPGALAVQLADSIGIAVAGIGFVVGAFFGVSALSSPLMGRVAERLGWASAMRAAALAAGAALELTPLVTRSFVTLGGVTVLGGVALALAHPAVNLGLARCTAVTRQGLVFGFKHAAIPASSALAGLALPLVAIPLGWKWVYALAALVAVGAASLVPSSPRRFEVDRRHLDQGETGDGRSSLSLLVIVAVGAGLGIFGTDALAVFLVPFAVNVGFGEAPAGMLLAIGSGAGILTRLLAGWQIDRAASTGLRTVAVFLALGAVGIAVLAIGAPVAVVAGSLLAFALGWGWSGLFTFSVVRRNPNQPAAATGVAMIGIYVGAATGPVVFGILAERVSFTVGWVAMATALALGALLMMLAVVRERA